MAQDEKGQGRREAMIYKRGKRWWYKFTWNGKLIRKSTKQGNAQTARDIEARHRSSLVKGEVGLRDLKDVPTLRKFCSDRIEPYAKKRNKSVWYGSGIRALLKYPALSDSSLAEISTEKALAFAASRADDGITAGSINSSLRVLRRILRLAVKWGIIAASPEIEMLPDEARRERVVSREEESRYLATASPLLTEAATLLFDTGLRPDELHRMRWEHIEWSKGRNGSLFIAKGKTRAARRSIPLSARCASILRLRWQSQGNPAVGWVWPAPTKTGHIDHSTTRKQHRNALVLSKVRPFVLYSVRHTFLTRLGASGCDVWTLMRIAGHSSVAISSRYVHPDDATVLNAINRMEPMQGTEMGTRERLEIGKDVDLSSINDGIDYSYLVSADGLEPSTHALKGLSSYVGLTKGLSSYVGLTLSAQNVSLAE
jgi:integrase